MKPNGLVFALGVSFGRLGVTTVYLHHIAGHGFFLTHLRPEGCFLSNSLHFQFGDYTSSVTIQEKLPHIEEIYTAAGYDPSFPPKTLVVCDKNTLPLARKIADSLPIEELIPGEERKNWLAVEAILRAAGSRHLGRDGLFIGVGGGVVCDLAAFAASIYMRGGAALALVPTTLLCMVDAALGGKTGFDLEGFKNLAGTFYPAGTIIAPLEALATLPQTEWHSGMAELIKTAILDTDPKTFEQLQAVRGFSSPKEAFNPKGPSVVNFVGGDPLADLVARAVQVKGNIVAADPRETGTERALLNLGHTFGHALESALGLGKITHGAAVAWGMARSCELGLEMGITQPSRAAAILEILNTWEYETSIDAFLGNTTIADSFREALLHDKKRKAGKPRFVIPAAERAVLVDWDERIQGYMSKNFQCPIA